MLIVQSLLWLFIYMFNLFKSSVIYMYNLHVIYILILYQQQMFKQQQKMFQQARVVQSQRLKTIKQLHDQFTKVNQLSFTKCSKSNQQIQNACLLLCYICIMNYDQSGSCSCSLVYSI